MFIELHHKADGEPNLFNMNRIDLIRPADKFDNGSKLYFNDSTGGIHVREDLAAIQMLMRQAIEHEEDLRVRARRRFNAEMKHSNT